MTLKPVLTLDEIERLIMEQFPRTDGERRCAFERHKMNELRAWKRKQYQQQNLNNIAHNEYAKKSIKAG